MRKTVFLFLGLLVVSIFAKAQSNRYNFSHINYSHGLSNNYVLCVEKGSDGLIWVGTTNGLNRFDGYTIKTYKNDRKDSLSLPDNYIQTITKDQLGRLWIRLSNNLVIFNPLTERIEPWRQEFLGNQKLTTNSITQVIPFADSLMILCVPSIGLIKHNIYTKQNTQITPNTSNGGFILQANITDMKVKGNNLYLIYPDGMFDVFDVVENKVIKRITALAEIASEPNYTYRIYIDYDQNYWVLSNTVSNGLYLLDAKHNSARNFNNKTEPKLSSNIVANITQDADSNYWIGTDHGGITILDKTLKNAIYLNHQKDNVNSLSQNVITTLFKDNSDIIWVGTHKQGLNFYHKNLFKFYHYQNHPSNPNSLPFNDVNCFAEDKKGNLWIGTNGEGLFYFDRSKDAIVPFSKINKVGSALINQVIVSLRVDKQNRLWIGTYHGGLCLYDGETVKNFMHQANNNFSLCDNKIWEIFQDRGGNIWIGTLSGGVDRFLEARQEFIHYNGTDYYAINSNCVMDIVEDAQGNIWFGTDKGAFALNSLSGRVSHFLNTPLDPNSLSHNYVYAMLVDSKGRLWLGTRSGLNLKIGDTFKSFFVSDGLPDNTILAIKESNEGDIWVSTQNGLCKITLETNSDGSYKAHRAVNYNESDGLQGREFNEGSALKTSKGELIFGGPNGFNLFETASNYIPSGPVYTYIFGIDLFTGQAELKPAKPTTDSNQAILNNQTVKINYRENIFTINFAAVEYLRAKKIKYQYQLEGFNNQWITTDWQNRKATYTNISPGKYKFRVKAFDADGQWNAVEAVVNIVVLPPWYRTIWAFIGYYIVLFGLIMLFRQLLLNRERLKYKQKQAIEESVRQQELNRLKTRFFTNVSHEFRTPLTLLITPLERLLKQNHEADTQKSLQLIHQNAKRLLGLVNQLLDFRKAEENRIVVQYVYGNIYKFIDDMVLSFSDLRESKHIKLEYQSLGQELYMQFDPDKTEKIIFNLLSNAFKFTPDGGSISVEAKVMIEMNNELLVISVADTGIGISEENQKRIFERFFQSELPTSFISKGSGIGLSLTSDFVELLKGTISVTSELGKGSVFTVKLPVNRDKTVAEMVTPERNNYQSLQPNEAFEAGHQPQRANILLVEDNDDFRFYLKDNLKEKYNIKEAANGRIALDMLAEFDPNLIVSDVMMPEMDGLELCHNIKTNPEYSHIPVILLTAKVTVSDKLEGYSTGADDYLTKPFNFEILESRIAYLIAQRKRFIRQYQKSFIIEPETSVITPLDSKLLSEALVHIEKNISEPGLSVESLSRELNMSRVHLYKKILALTGKTPIEYIRLVRLRKAAELLINSHLTISEVGYEVGFSDPRYFSKQFKAEFHMLPSKFKESQAGLNA